MEVFADTFVPEGVADVWFATRGCPACLGPRLVRVEGTDQSHWLCRTCGHCFRAEHGLLRLTDPLTCHGCAARSRVDCIGVLTRTFPRFGAGSATDVDARSL